MLSLLSEIHFWSIQDDILIKPTDYGAFKYNVKKDPSDQIYQNVKRNYKELRGSKQILINKRHNKLKDKLKELEETLLQNKVIYQTWIEDTLKILLSKGLIVSIKVKSSDILSIHFDKSLLTKVQNEVICDGVIVGNHVVCICKDGRVFGHGGLWRDWTIECGSDRNLSLQGDLLAVWGKTGSEHPQPWRPLAKDHQRANLHLYCIGATGPDLLAYKKMDGEPIKVYISKMTPKHIIVVEQKVSPRGTASIEVCLWQLAGNLLKRSTVTSVRLKTQVSCAALSPKETFLMLCCINGSVALLDRNRGSSKIIKAAFIPTHVTWHRSEALATISNERGQLQYFDTALNCINIQFIGEDPIPTTIIDISNYFNSQRSVEMLFWGPKELLVALEQGPLIVITHPSNSLSFIALIQLYLKSNDVSKALRLLLSRTFDEQAFCALQKIVAHILRENFKPANCKLLQDALGSFHCPRIPLSVDVRHRFGPQVKSLTRRYFHQLIRSEYFETAFLLAVDMGYHDLFMDLHYIAVKIGDTEMAAAARAQASSLLSRCSSEASNCSRSSCSQCSDSISSTSEDSKEETQTHHSNDNYLSTNFNNPVPKTYRAAYVPPIPNIDLPKIKLASKPPPPLPNSNQTGYLIPNNLYNLVEENLFMPIPRTATPPVRISQPLRVAPPLPVAPPLISSTTQKKPQAKVKFSDTVTAFIVPEVKRPVRVPPPAHMMDPQKELADSLPLCHPNEDYLKDFTPIQREASESPPVQPKIKVVHFGVV